MMAQSRVFFRDLGAGYIAPAPPVPWGFWRALRSHPRTTLRFWWTGQHPRLIRLEGHMYYRDEVDRIAQHEVRNHRADPRQAAQRRWWPGWPWSALQKGMRL